MPHVTPPGDEYVLMIGLGLPTNDEIDLRVAPGAEADLLLALDAEGISYGKIMEFSAGAGDWGAYSVVAVSTAAVVRQLTHALATFLGRHSDKSVKVSLQGKTTEFNGYSEKEVEQLLKAVSVAMMEEAEKWERVAKQRPQDPRTES